MKVVCVGFSVFVRKLFALSMDADVDPEAGLAGTPFKRNPVYDGSTGLLPGRVRPPRPVRAGCGAPASSSPAPAPACAASDLLDPGARER